MPEKLSGAAETTDRTLLSVEDSALERLLAYLHGSGHRADLLRRPDRLARDAPAVDAELSVDGELIAVEVTRLTRAPREHREIAAFEDALKEPLESLRGELALDHVVISIEFRRLPRRQEIAAGLPLVREEIASAMRRLRPGMDGRSEIQVTESVNFIRHLEVIHFPAANRRVSWITGSEDWGGYIDPIADEFVEHLLSTKPRQTKGYREAWVVVVDWAILVDAQDLQEALRRRLAHVPMNWTKVFLLPATDHSSVNEIALASMREGLQGAVT